MGTMRRLGETRRNMRRVSIKGARAYAEGRLQTRKYDDREGKEHTVSEVVVRQLRFLGSPGNGNGKAEQSTRPPESSEPEIGDGDIPF